MSFLVFGSGLICVMMFALGFGIIIPVSSAIGEVFDMIAVASGMVFVGLLDGE